MVVMTDDNKELETNKIYSVKQETCECGNRSFFIICYHETEYKENEQSDKHNWIVICTKCGKYLDNDDLFYNMHEKMNKKN